MQTVQTGFGLIGFRSSRLARVVPGALTLAALGCSTLSTEESLPTAEGPDDNGARTSEAVSDSTGSSSNQAALMPADTDLVSDAARARSNISFAGIDSAAVPPLSVLYYEETSGEASVQLRYSVRGKNSGAPTGQVLNLVAAYRDEPTTLELGSAGVVFEVDVSGEYWRAEAGALQIAAVVDGTLRLSLSDVVLTRTGSETMGPLSGTISGEIERSCFPLPEGDMGDLSQPVPEREQDVAWASKFCARFAH